MVKKPSVAFPILIFLIFWFIYGLTPNKPFVLQGAILEQFVERGRLYFTEGELVNESALVNLETQTEQFKTIPYNMFEHEGRYFVNHSVGQFVLGYPWYQACVSLGFKFSNNYDRVWSLLRWTLIGPLGALAVAALFIIAIELSRSRSLSFLVSGVVGIGTPWWIVATHYYHDMFATALLAVGAAAFLVGIRQSPIRQYGLLIFSGMCLGWAVFTSYLVIPLALVVAGLFAYKLKEVNKRVALLISFFSIACLLPITNLVFFGSFTSTGYSISNMSDNYPSIFDIQNIFEKFYFYLFSPMYGLWVLFPGLMLACFWFAGAKKTKKGADHEVLGGRKRLAIIALLLIHLFTISSMRHHGSVLWGMGRFFIPAFFLAGLLVPNIFATAQRQFNSFHMLMTALLIQGVFHAGMIARIDLHPGNLSFMRLAYEKFGQLFLAAPTISLMLALLIHIGLFRLGRRQMTG